MDELSKAARLTPQPCGTELAKLGGEGSSARWKPGLRSTTQSQLEEKHAVTLANPGHMWVLQGLSFT